jgi:hypothetical protein
MLRLLLALAAAAATAAPGATDAEAKREAEHARLGSVIEPAELEAVPPGSRAVLEQLLDQVVTLRGEVGSLKAGKLASDARAARLSERVDGLEIMCADHDTQHAAEAPQREAPQPRENATTSTEPRRRTQASQACARGQDFQVLTAAAMDACCPSGGGHHRRSLQASCSLPATCPSAACAAVFVPFMADCDAMLSTMPGLMLTQFQSFAASCSELQAGAGIVLQPVAVQMFRVLVTTEGAAQAGGMFPGGGDTAEGGGGYGKPLDPLQPLLPPASAPFIVNSGPCTLATSGSQYCVGRPSGYTNSESCQITSSAAGTLTPCPIFVTETGCK